jgi:hypothetical protein
MVLETVLNPSLTGLAERRRVEHHAWLSTLGLANRDAAAGAILSILLHATIRVGTRVACNVVFQ